MAARNKAVPARPFKADKFYCRPNTLACNLRLRFRAFPDTRFQLSAISAARNYCSSPALYSHVSRHICNLGSAVWLYERNSGSASKPCICFYR